MKTEDEKKILKQKSSAAKLLSSITEKIPIIDEKITSQKGLHRQQAPYQCKLFIGVLITYDIQTLINDPQHLFQETFTEISLEDKKFIGFFLEEKTLPLTIIEKNISEFRKRLLSFCPTLNQKELNIQIFSQIMIG